ncbi:MAG: hypothetical protein K9H64_04510 [Bacteroidales bacterium]|nr:hypothetical protein [Bacteroidales bacterium]MCF8455134.1 hypothetical protein [Bacteroidales bacterium]
MDLQSRKLNAIAYLVGLKDKKVFQKIESTIFENINSVESKREFKPFTRQQLIDRANRSNNDYLIGKFMTQEQLEKESETGKFMKIIWSNSIPLTTQ